MDEDHRIRLLDAICLWRDIAAQEIDDIKGWRQSTDEDWEGLDMPNHIYDRIVSGRGWNFPKNFYSLTQRLFRLIAIDFPRLDPQPTQEIFGAIESWHKQKNAKDLPEQANLAELHDNSLLYPSAAADDLH